MRKILSGMLGLIMTTAVVGGVAYAAFTTTATVEGMSIAAGTATLFVGPVGNATTSNYPAPVNLTNVYPGFGAGDTQHADFDISNGGTIPLATVTAQLTSAVNWGNGLENYVLVAVDDVLSNTGTGYHTLSDWYTSGGYPLTGGSFAVGATRTYRAYVKVDPSAPNSIQGLSLTNITFTLTGAQ